MLHVSLGDATDYWSVDIYKLHTFSFFYFTRDSIFMCIHNYNFEQ